VFGKPEVPEIGRDIRSLMRPVICGKISGVIYSRLRRLDTRRHPRLARPDIETQGDFSKLG